MRKPLVLALTAVLLGAPTAGTASGSDEPEGCQVANPGQPTCTYTVTHSGGSPVEGIAGVGSWVVKVKAGKKTTTYKSPASGQPTEMTFVLHEGEKVTMQALTPGSAGTVGHVD